MNESSPARRDRRSRRTFSTYVKKVRRPRVASGWGGSPLFVPALFCLLLFGFAAPLNAAREGAPEAELKISGYGFLGNRDLKRLLQALDTDEEREFYDANYVEDAVLILMSGLQRDGYLHPMVAASLTLDDGSVVEFQWDEPLEEPLPRPMRLRRVHFQIDRRVLYHFGALEFSGLKALPEKRARSFFVETGALLRLRRHRIYTPERLRRGVASLNESLVRAGYRDATVVAEEVKRDDAAGKVDVRIRVEEGLRFSARSVRVETLAEDGSAPAVTTVRPGEPYSKLWEQDFAQQLRATNYHRGHPDTTVTMTTVKEERMGDIVHLDLQAVVRPGPAIKTGEIQFTGHKRTRESVLKRSVPLQEGEPLDRIQAERGRHRLVRLGIFESVELGYEPVDEETRAVTYRLEEGRNMEVSLLFGYGSYELLRGGVEMEQWNVFGRAHHSRLRAAQSFKSTSLDHLYTMPELFGESIDAFFRATAFTRQEVSFTREELTASSGVRRFFESIRSDVSLRYNYQILNAQRIEAEEAPAVRRATVGSLILDLKHDRRDNPLSPQRGYKVYSQAEVASDALGGTVNYLRLDASGSFHQPLGESHWLHLGLTQGVVLTRGRPEEDLPFNRRFFPGGDSSIRGFQLGEASPLSDDGEVIGAETFLLGSIELEQALTPRWSLVAFFDAIGFARDIGDYPMDEFLMSAGGGLRWKTVVGPVRLEYGHNLNPRRRDPSGTVHLSIGFPF